MEDCIYIFKILSYKTSEESLNGCVKQPLGSWKYKADSMDEPAVSGTQDGVWPQPVGKPSPQGDAFKAVTNDAMQR